MNKDIEDVVNDIISKTKEGFVRWCLDDLNVLSVYSNDNAKISMTRSMGIEARINGINITPLIPQILNTELWNVALENACKRFKEKYYGTD